MKVIIVDDEPDARELLQAEMRKIPQIKEIEMFGNPPAALDYAKENRIDVAFLDVKMPGINGIEMAIRLKDIYPKINIVFVSGYRRYAADAFERDASDFLVKPVTVKRIEAALRRLRDPVPESGRRIRAQTFGYFEFFLDNKPLVFSRSKAKEVLAYLIYRQGAFVSSADIAGILWEDSDYNRSKQKQNQTVISSMMRTLRENGIEDIIIKGHNQISVDKSKISCDFYDLLNGDPRAANSYSGEFMGNYSWAEPITGILNLKVNL